MTEYLVQAGDTFATVSRRTLGVETAAENIAAANPGAREPLSAGTVLVIPPLPGSPLDALQAGPADNVNECAILVDGQRFRFWTSVTITRSIDATSTIEFTAPFNAADAATRAAFEPFTYKPVTFTAAGESLFSGFILAPRPQVSDSINALSVTGLATPGVLNHCPLPASAYPLEFNDQTLEDIATAVVAPFGVPVVFEAPAGSAFERVASLPDKRALVFLAELAKQRGLVIGDTREGALAFRQSSVSGAPVARLVQGQSPLKSVTSFFDAEQYYSHVTGIEPVSVGSTGAQYTATNTRLTGVLRPHTFQVRDAVGGDVQGATEAKMGRMFANAASYTATVATWRDPQGALWEPNTSVSLMAPGAMIYSPYTFNVRSVALFRDASTETATLELVMPGGFSGQLPPRRLPWQS